MEATAIRAQSWRRWGGCSFAVLYVLGIALTSHNAIPGVDQPLSVLPGFYADSTNRVLVLLGAISLALSTPFLVAFAVGLSFEGREPARAIEASFVRATATAFAACIGISSVALGLVAGEVALRNVGQPSPELERWIVEFGYGILLVPGMAAAAAMTLLSTRLALDTPTLRRPVARAGYPIAVVCLAALPIATSTGDLIWSQLGIAAWAVATATLGKNARAAATPEQDAMTAARP